MHSLHYDLILENIHYQERNCIQQQSLLILPSPQPLTTTNLSLWICLCWVFHTNEIIQYTSFLFFNIWLFISDFFHFTWCFQVLFRLWTKLIWITFKLIQCIQTIISFYISLIYIHLFMETFCILYFILSWTLVYIFYLQYVYIQSEPISVVQ